MSTRADLRLLLQDARAGDQAHYRCRVDFVRAPTRTAAVRLEVISECRVAMQREGEEHH